MIVKAIAKVLERFLKEAIPRRVTFEDGSYIEPFNREALLYVERDGRQMEVVWFFRKGLAGGRVLHSADVSYWDPPHQGEALSMEKQREILDKVVEYSRQRGVGLTID